METTFQTLRTYRIRTTLREQKRFRYSVYMLMAAAVCILSVLYLDATQMVYPSVKPVASYWVHISRQITAEGFPEFSPLYLLRTLLIVLSAGLITGSVIMWANKQTPSKKVHAEHGATAYFKHDIFTTRGKSLALTILISICTYFLVIFLTDPAMFYWLCMEDHRIESFSDILQFLNCGLFIYIWMLLGRSKSVHTRLYRSVAATFAAFFFLCAMEEVSWFQRVLGIETPKAFAANIQYEMNLHNFATHPLENVYYFSAFAFLVFIPFVKERTAFLKRSALLSLFTPDAFVLLFSVPFVAYNYGNLNVSVMQLAVCMTIFILLDQLRLHFRQPGRFGWTLAILLLFVISQVLFLAYGHRMIRESDVKEFKEMLIPLSFFVFTIGVLKKLRSRQAANNSPEGKTGHLIEHAIP